MEQAGRLERILKRPFSVVVGTWNMQNAAEGKLEKKNVLSEIVRIFRRHDIVSVQEARNNGFLDLLVEHIGRGYRHVHMDAGDGRELYAFVYNPKRVEILDYSQSKKRFLRPPMLLHLKKGRFETVLINSHIDFDLAQRETNKLGRVMEEARERYGAEPIVAGDLNTDSLDGRYVSLIRWTAIPPQGVDTTTAGRKRDTIDRIVYGQSHNLAYWMVGRYNISVRNRFAIKIMEPEVRNDTVMMLRKDISDHLPVTAAFYKV